MMKPLTKKQQQEYEKYLRDKRSGRILTPDVLRFICEAHNYNAERIGQHFLDLLSTMKGNSL